MKKFFTKLICLCLLASTSVFALEKQPSVAFFYGENPPLMDLQAFDVAVVEPDFVENPGKYARAAKDGEHTLFAYIALGEVQPSRAYYDKLPKSCLAGSNEAWGSRVINQTCPAWQSFFLDTIIAPLWKKGWRGFFVDTLDSYQMFSTSDAERSKQTRAMVSILRELKRRYPEAKLMLNRGFELMPEIGNITYAVAAESLYQGYEAGSVYYRPVPDNDHAWLLGKMKEVRDTYHLPVISIDYVDPTLPNARELARETAKKISALGFIPWVADGNLMSIGVGSIELIPRDVLVLVNTHSAGGTQETDLDASEAQRFIGAPLNYLGLRYHIVDLDKQPLPSTILTGRYAGIVTWMQSAQYHAELGAWLKNRITEGMRVAVFGSLGFTPTKEVSALLGLENVVTSEMTRLFMVNQDTAFMGFEISPTANRLQPTPFTLSEEGLKVSKSLLTLNDEFGNRYDAAALTNWGGYVFSPYDVAELRLTDQARWVVNPLKFLKAAFNLPDLPVPDVTTEGGRRILMVHVDGDGFSSRAEIKGIPFAGEVMRQEFLERYRLPTTVSVIEGDISATGPHQKMSAELEGLAKNIFALPYVEGASHSYIHPLHWKEAVKLANSDTAGMSSEGDYSIEVPNYHFDLDREIKGSMDYIDQRLMPSGKKSKVFLWTGDCSPPAEAIEKTYRYGYLNMNGGDTLINKDNPSWTAIFPQGVRKEGWYQVYAPNQNENMYTNEWTGPFYGYERVIETFELTDKNYRSKPVDIYYHFYSASKAASIRALHKVYQWAIAQPLTHIYASQYIQKVLDFESTTLARESATGDVLVRTGGQLRTLRQAGDIPFSAWAGSTGLAGVTPYRPADKPELSTTYLTLSSGEVRLSSHPHARPQPYIAEANGRIDNFSQVLTAKGSETRFDLTSQDAPLFSLAQADACEVRVDQKLLKAMSSKKSIFYGTKSLSKLSSPSIIPPKLTLQTAYKTYEPQNNNASSRHLVSIQCHL